MRILKWAGFGFLGVIGAVGLLAAAMWASEDVRYRVLSARTRARASNSSSGCICLNRSAWSLVTMR